MAEEHCQKCGAVLPSDQDEGLCPVCGTPFGAKTTAIDISGGALEAEMRKRTQAQNPAAQPAPASSGPPMPLIVGGALVIAGLILAILFVVLK